MGPSSGFIKCTTCRHFGDEAIGADYCHLWQTILPPSWDFPQRCQDWSPRPETGRSAHLNATPRR